MILLQRCKMTVIFQQQYLKRASHIETERQSFRGPDRIV